MAIKLFDKYRRLMQVISPDFCNKLINYAEGIKGFLVNHQNSLVFLISNDLRDNAEAAEIGVYFGRTTAILRLGNPNYKLHCIDTFLGSEEHQADLKGYKYRVDFENNLANRGLYQNIEIHEGFSIDKAKEFKDGSLDLVWIDAGHSFDDVCSDIEAWTPKLKSGGIILGHDMPEHPYNQGFAELYKAVMEKVANNPEFCEFDAFCNIWGARKV